MIPPGAGEWLSALPPALDKHRAILRGLLSESDQDPRIRLLLVGCSIGRGAADALSDIDAYLGVEPGVTPDALGVEALVHRLGDVVDLYHQAMPGADGPPNRRTFVQFRSGVQLDMVVGEAPERRGRRPDWVVLHDPDGRIADDAEPRSASQAQLREWAYSGWERLSACAKYIARGSSWEALEALHSARREAWRLWAIAQRVPDPEYGLTAVLDSSSASLPPGIDATVAGLDGHDLLQAASACADLLETLWPAAAGTLSLTEPPPPLAEWVRAQLAVLSDARSTA